MLFHGFGNVLSTSPTTVVSTPKPVDSMIPPPKPVFDVEDDDFESVIIYASAGAVVLSGMG
ncbi:hypothetical protein M408DRAFT_329710 [Serendipita vermifera MAFF 305830]|uniref:Uncharacterized protein n=1 Tax=Serendipita vermifera MAFF 305830 TaxID=933852 RepID=A0A0C2XG58_SERVB|nr:hypothetical protein M408DRAFT_329710 [Serendipita vermifera MAFF 305830]